MATSRQIAANRRNAKKSTGPKSAAGKAASSGNATSHGLTGKDVVLPFEDRSEFDQLRADLLAEHQPTTPTENFQVEQMAMAMWRLRRLRKTETAYLEMEIERHESTVDSNYDSNGPWNHVAHAFRYDAINSNTLVNLSRYEVRLERAYYKALHELQRLKAADLGTDQTVPQRSRGTRDSGSDSSVCPQVLPHPRRPALGTDETVPQRSRGTRDSGSDSSVCPQVPPQPQQSPPPTPELASFCQPEKSPGSHPTATKR